MNQKSPVQWTKHPEYVTELIRLKQENFQWKVIAEKMNNKFPNENFTVDACESQFSKNKKQGITIFLIYIF